MKRQLLNTTRRRAVAIATSLLLLAGTALAWDYAFPINAKVNGHDFHRVRVDGADCALKVKLDFTAPKAGYESRSKNRNRYYFRARLLFKNGKSVTTPVFGNGAAGERTYKYVHDTGDEACWSKERVELKDVDFVGCRGEGCKVKSFARVIPDYGG